MKIAFIEEVILLDRKRFLRNTFLAAASGAMLSVIIGLPLKRLLNEMSTFGKLEGDVRVQAEIKKEKEMFKKAVKQMENIELDAKKIISVKKTINHIRDSLKRLEDLKGIAVYSKEVGNYEGSLKNLKAVLAGLSEFSDKETQKWLLELFTNTGLGPELAQEVFRIIKELEQDVRSDIDETEREKEAMMLAMTQHREQEASDWAKKQATSVKELSEKTKAELVKKIEAINSALEKSSELKKKRPW